MNLDLSLSNNDIIIPEMEKMGGELVKKNMFFKDLSEIMSDKKVTRFFDKYFKNTDSIKTTVIYMKLFRLFQDKYNKISDDELSNYVNIYILHKAMTTDSIRSKLINATMEHLDDNTKSILDLI
jgi:hypothetical protein